MPKPSLTELVQEVVAEVLPRYRLAETVGGGAPQLVFVRPDSGDRPLLREKVWFSKLRWGLPELDVGLALELLGPAIGGAPRAYPAAPLGPERRVKVDPDLLETLRRELPEIDRHASEVFGLHHPPYPRMQALADDLARLYLAWRGEMPADLRDVPAMLASAPELQGVDEETAALRRHKLFPSPGRELQARRLAHFRRWLTERGRLAAPEDPAGFWLNGFWETGRPRTAEELRIDKHLGDECAVCHEMRTRGRVVTKTDPVFGQHAEFVCTKCGPR